MRVAEYPDQISISTAKPVAVEGPEASSIRPGITDELLLEARVLRRLGFGKPLISKLLLEAARNATSLEAELMASGAVQPDIYYEALAELLGLPFLRTLDPTQVVEMQEMDFQLIKPRMVRINYASQPPLTALVPTAARFAQVQDSLNRSPRLRTLLAATTPQAVREVVWRAGAPRRMRETTCRLFDAVPEHSARITFWGKQGFYTGAACSAVLFTSVALPQLVLMTLHLVLTSLFFSGLVIRLSALFGLGQDGGTQAQSQPAEPHPTYSVFVPLYREADIVPQLLLTLDRLDWPLSRLDIKLICEADDIETLRVLREAKLGTHYEIVEVPPGLPRTKPKAMTYALPAARGDYLVIYDAEDRPHPRQLLEAWSRFSAAPADLACLQAPLVVSNGGASWISALFSLEYAGLFRRLLPLLAVGRLPMPLGGTSNHFRTEILKRSGGWDPYNVTEDADLGLRLCRLGYTCGTLSLPTLEDAPDDVQTWLGQRTRWFKGWLQTWLVLMRRPLNLIREIGPLRFAVFQVLIGGMLLSSLAHPLLIGYVAHLVWQMTKDGPFTVDGLQFWLFVIDIANIFGSYAIFIALGRSPMSAKERNAIGARWVFVFGYWLLMSLAAWRALAELRKQPFFWNKTTHRPVGR